MMRFAATPFFIAIFFQSAIAFQTGAGSCNEGNNAVQSPHTTRGTVFNASLAFGGFSVSLYNIETGSIQLVQDTVSTFPATINTALTITANIKTFKGFLMRLGETDVMTDQVFLENPSNTELQISPLCTSIGVGGVTHTNNNEKTTITAFFNVDAVANKMPLDVTVVVSNSAVSDVSEYFYSRFFLTASERSPSTSTPATNAPIEQGSSATPVNPPVVNTEVPTTAAPVIPATNSPITLAPVATMDPITQAPVTLSPSSQISGSGTITPVAVSDAPVSTTAAPVGTSTPATNAPIEQGSSATPVNPPVLNTVAPTTAAPVIPATNSPTTLAPVATMDPSTQASSTPSLSSYVKATQIPTRMTPTLIPTTVAPIVQTEAPVPATPAPIKISWSPLPATPFPVSATTPSPATHTPGTTVPAPLSASPVTPVVPETPTPSVLSFPIIGYPTTSPSLKGTNYPYPHDHNSPQSKSGSGFYGDDDSPLSPVVPETPTSRVVSFSTIGYPTTSPSLKGTSYPYPVDGYSPQSKPVEGIYDDDNSLGSKSAIGLYDDMSSGSKSNMGSTHIKAPKSLKRKSGMSKGRKKLLSSKYRNSERRKGL